MRLKETNRGETNRGSTALSQGEIEAEVSQKNVRKRRTIGILTPHTPLQQQKLHTHTLKQHFIENFHAQV